MSDKTFEQMGELAKLVERAAEFGRSVMKENQELRKTIRHLERKPLNGSDTSAATHPSTTTDIPAPGAEMKEQLDVLKEENQDLADQYVRLEAENDNLLNFYVASHQLHSTLRIREVLSTIQEIVINLIGADRFAVYLNSEEKEGLFSAAACEGMNLAELPDISLNEDPAAECLASGSMFFVDEINPDKTELIAGVPLAVDGQILGAIMIYGLLDHKDGFGELDHGLFALLAQHAGTSLMAAQLYAASERRRETFESATRILLEKS